MKPSRTRPFADDHRVMRRQPERLPSRFPVASRSLPGSTAVSDGWSGQAKVKHVKHDANLNGSASAHALLPRPHRLFASLKRRAVASVHGRHRKHLLQSLLDEFLSRFKQLA